MKVPLTYNYCMIISPLLELMWTISLFSTLLWTHTYVYMYLHSLMLNVCEVKVSSFCLCVAWRGGGVKDEGA